MSEEIYKQKYLKYKEKYLKLKGGRDYVGQLSSKQLIANEEYQQKFDSKKNIANIIHKFPDNKKDQDALDYADEVENKYLPSASDDQKHIFYESLLRDVYIPNKTYCNCKKINDTIYKYKKSNSYNQEIINNAKNRCKECYKDGKCKWSLFSGYTN